MTDHPIADALVGELRTAEHGLENLAHRAWPLRGPAAAQQIPAAQTAPAVPATQETRMTVSALLADADKAARALVKHVGILASNPLIDTLVDAGLGLVLTPGEITAVVGFIKAIESERTALAAPVGAAEAAAKQFAADGTQQAQATLSGAQPVQTGAM